MVSYAYKAGLNIFSFKRNRITNKHKAYEWLSRRKTNNILTKNIHTHSFTYNRYTLLTYQVMRNKNHQATICDWTCNLFVDYLKRLVSLIYECIILHNFSFDSVFIFWSHVKYVPVWESEYCQKQHGFLREILFFERCSLTRILKKYLRDSTSTSHEHIGLSTQSWSNKWLFK